MQISYSSPSLVATERQPARSINYDQQDHTDGLVGYLERFRPVCAPQP